jgi:hypothetical protein
MKKIYLSALALATISTATAQRINQNTFAPVGKHTTIGELPSKSTINQTKATVLWDDDFSTASNWIFSNASTPAHGWVISTNPTATNIVAALSPFASTTASNGYAFCNSDAAGTGSTTDATIQWDGTPIDLTGQPNVTLRFQTATRNFASDYFVEVSNDGSNWTSYDVLTEITTNINTTNPQLVNLNISATAANQGTVWIRFKYTASWGWFWAVDDVEIIATEDFDLKLANINWGVEGAWGDRLAYGRTPIAQIAPVKFSGIIENIGAVSQSTIEFTASTTGYTGVGVLASLAASAQDSAHATTDFTPAASVGSTTMNFSVTSPNTDADPSNNTFPALTFSRTQNIYSRGGTTATGGSFNAGEGFEVGNVYDIFAAGTIHSVRVFVASTAVAGSEVFATVYSIDPSTGDFIFETSSNPVTLTAANLGAEINIPVLTPYTVTVGSPVLVVAGSFGNGGTSNDLVVGTAGISPAQTTFYYDYTNTTWYYTTATAMVSIDFSAQTGVEETVSTMTLGQNIPNPSNGNTTVNYTLASTEDITFEITDMTGKLVQVIREGVRTAGSYAVNFNTNELSEGVYFYTLTNGTSKVTKSMVVTK